MCKQVGRIAGVVLILACILVFENGEIAMLAIHAQTVVHVVHHVVTTPEIPHPITMHPIVHVTVVVLTKAQQHAIHLNHLRHLEHLRHLVYVRHLGKLKTPPP